MIDAFTVYVPNLGLDLDIVDHVLDVHQVPPAFSTSGNTPDVSELHTVMSYELTK